MRRDTRLVLERTYGQVLKEPRAHDVGGDFREDASLLLTLLVAVIVVVVTGSVA